MTLPPFLRCETALECMDNGLARCCMGRYGKAMFTPESYKRIATALG